MWQVKGRYINIDEHAYFQLVFRMSAQEDAVVVAAVAQEKINTMRKELYFAFRLWVDN